MIVNPVRPLRRLSLLASVVICAAIPGAAHADKYAGAFMESGGGARALGRPREHPGGRPGERGRPRALVSRAARRTGARLRPRPALPR